MREIKIENHKLYSSVSLDQMLIDTRQATYGLKFGTVRDICKQYGIKHLDNNGLIEFSAPKQRLQMLLEKLHFARVGYRKG